MEQPNVQKSLSTDTHSYDGKLIKAKSELMQDVSRVSLVPVGTKLEGFALLRESLLRLPISPGALQCFDVIVRTFKQVGGSPSNPNYDPTNDLYADDLLYLCFEQIVVQNNQDMATTLISQLEDMVTGLCAQGRTTRLFQVLMAYKV